MLSFGHQSVSTVCLGSFQGSHSSHTCIILVNHWLEKEWIKCMSGKLKMSQEAQAFIW